MNEKDCQAENRQGAKLAKIIRGGYEGMYDEFIREHMEKGWSRSDAEAAWERESRELEEQP